MTKGRLLLRALGLTGRIVLVGWLVVHFTLTIIYVFPLNPIKIEVGWLADVTIGTYFPQNWSLFAPSPVASTQLLLVRCLDRSEVESGPLPEDGWEDISTAHFQQAVHNRFSAYERMVRPLQNGLRTALSGGVDLYPFQQACKKGETAACKVSDDAMTVRRKYAGALFQRIGSAYCREVHPGRDLVAVAVRFRERAGAPWSKRNETETAVSDYDLGVFKLDTQVALPGLYANAEGR